MNHKFTFFAVLMMELAFSTTSFAVNSKTDYISNFPNGTSDTNSSYSNIWRIWSKCMDASPSTYFDVELSNPQNAQVIYIGPIVHYPEIYRLTLTGTYTVATNTLVVDIRNDVDLGDGWVHCRTDRHTTQLTSNAVYNVIGVLTYDGMAGCTTAIDVERLFVLDTVVNDCLHPFSLNAEGVSRNEITLHINGDDSANYRIYYTDGLFMDSVLTSDTVYTLTGLQMGTTYSISVISICGNGTRSNPMGTTASTLSCSNDCYIHIDMADSYGDGWNGNAINGYNGESLFFSATIEHGYNGSFSYRMCDEDTIALKWQTENWPEEASFSVHVGSDYLLSGNGQNYSTGETIVLIGGCSTTDSTDDNNDTNVVAFNENGASYSTFSISDSHMVRFSKGNLQYNAQGTHATNDGSTAQGTWRFAEHQYDYVGNGNENASSYYNGWIDLFGWGTSGWNGGAYSYQPWSTDISTNSNYCPGGNADNDLADGQANADWAVYNAISNGGNVPNMWRTLTSDEFVYLFETRTTSTLNGTVNARYVKAKVNGVGGVILFPDVYTHPEGVPIPSGINTSTISIIENVYSFTQWAQMEIAGCVFLPMAGDRYGTWYRNEGIYGCYWSSTHYNNYHAYVLHFLNSQTESYLNPSQHYNRYDGYSVRPVMDVTSFSSCVTTYRDTVVTVCDNYMWQGFEVSTDTVLVDTLYTIDGCDSIVSQHIIIHNSSTSVDTIKATNSYSWADSIYTVSGIYQHTWSNSYGCDSTVTLWLTISRTIYDTLIINDTVHFYDTLYVDIPYTIHDTTYIDVYIHDTTTVVDTVTLTEYVPVHDTTYIDVYVHDTTTEVDTVTLTEYVPVHDTTYIDVYVHDTTTVVDTVTLTEYVPVHDTTYIIQTDTVTNTVYDTITNTVFDTIINTVFDTTVVFGTDTLWLHDTVFIHDTIYIHDTIVVGVDEVDAISAKVYTSHGQIVVEGAEGNTVWLYDVSGRVLATKQEEDSPLHFDVPASGAYMVKIGNHHARKVIVIR